ncbi:hypothetical protein ACFC18_52600, partial [Streptomyces sp. NPDC056121]|uniref:hypothetical protein n=1 Tax=Streptomyces sp. NPDC056121 TaxID=3345718 RepID=UPI0035D85A7B
TRLLIVVREANRGSAGYWFLAKLPVSTSVRMPRGGQTAHLNIRGRDRLSGMLHACHHQA